MTADGGVRWALQRSELSLPEMNEASFASPSDGLGFPSLDETGLASTGVSGMRTTDAGRSWASVSWPAPASLGSYATEIPFGTVTFANGQHGWAGGADGVEATVNGGSKWAPQLATSEPVGQLSFAGPENGWALTPDELFTTSDGGRQWESEPETALGAFSYVQLVTPRFGLGVVCGLAGGTRALATHDQGRTWSPLPLPDPDELRCGSVETAAGTSSGLCFGNPKVGWAILHGTFGGPALLERTDDGGLTWSAVATTNVAPSALACEGGSDAWIGLNWLENMSTVGSVARTTDGGKTWAISVHPAPRTVFSVPVIKPSDGSAVGTLATSQSPPGILAQPVSLLAAPAAGSALDLWTDYGPSCTNGFGLAITTDAGTTWTGQGASPGSPPCHMVALPFLSAVASVPPSPSFPNTEDGFVLGPAAGTPSVPKGTAEQVTMALIGTSDGGRSWHLLAHLP